MNAAKVRFDARRCAAAYSEAFQRFKQLPGFDQKAVLLDEAGVILKTWAGRTKVTTAEKAERRMRSGVAWKMGIQFAGGNNKFGITINDGSRGGDLGQVWFRTKNHKWQDVGRVYSGGYFSASFLHYKDDDWARIEAGAVTYAKMIVERRKKVQRSLGLSRQAVIQIADQLGIDLNKVRGGGALSGAGIAKARAAIASSGTPHNNGIGLQGGDTTKCYVDLICRLPYGAKIGMDRQLAYVLSGRAKYIEQSYKTGAFDSMKGLARAFPNMITTANLN